MKATDVIRRDHKAAEELFEKFKQASPDAREAMAPEVFDALTAHETMEDKHFYPALRDADVKDASYFSALEAEQMKLAASVLAARALPGNRGDRIIEMMDDVLAHAKKEEAELLPEAEAKLSAEKLEELGAAMEPDSAVAKTSSH
jgi:hemerythrin superfamily protein